MGKMNTKLIAVAAIIGIVLSVAACRPGGWFAAKPYKETQFLMDTIVEITAYGPNAETAVKAAFGEFKRLHDVSNNFDAASEVSAVNQAAGRQPVKVSADLVAMIKRANELSAKLNGSFDVTVGPLTDLWAIGRKGDYVPTQAEIDKVLPLVDYRQVVMDEGAATVYLPKAGMKLDLGGIAKGYAVDRAIDILKTNGVQSALINAGGDVRIIGRRPDGNPWRIGVQHPRSPDTILARLALTDWDTMETSGDYQRFIIKDNVRYSHILDPRTGRQPRLLTSVTMVLNNSADGDIFSTALFVLGPEQGLALLRQFPGVEAIMMTADGKVLVSPGLTGKVELEK
jgi:thiamine biosynthesis lipoprotein